MGPMLEKTGNNVWVGAVVAEGAAYGPDWKTLVLQVRCRLVLSSLSRCRWSIEQPVISLVCCFVGCGACVLPCPQDRKWDETNTKIFPKTTALLKDMGVRLGC